MPGIALTEPPPDSEALRSRRSTSLPERSKRRLTSRSPCRTPRFPYKDRLSIRSHRHRQRSGDTSISDEEDFVVCTHSRSTSFREFYFPVNSQIDTAFRGQRSWENDRHQRAADSISRVASLRMFVKQFTTRRNRNDPTPPVNFWALFLSTPA